MSALLASRHRELAERLFGLCQPMNEVVAIGRDLVFVLYAVWVGGGASPAVPDEPMLLKPVNRPFKPRIGVHEAPRVPVPDGRRVVVRVHLSRDLV